MRWATLLACLCLAPGAAEADCRQALAVALDVSGSVDAEEYGLQISGLAAALDAPGVRAALLSAPEAPVRIAVYEWSGPSSQSLILPWTEIADDAALDAAIATIGAAMRREAELSTAIGSAMEAGFALLGQQTACLVRTLDISGDGPSNTGPRPEIVRARAAPPGVTVNALVVGVIPEGGDDRAEDIRQLAAYYRANVLTGAGAFVEMAVGYAAYKDAMERKLLRELSALAIGSADPAERRADPIRDVPARPL